MRLYWRLLLIELLGGVASAVQAQPETRSWRFGDGAGLRFPAAGPPTASPASALTSREACSAISDEGGLLLCYTNAEQVWDRNNALMPNGALQFGHNSATQGALLVPSPGGRREYYLFTVDAAERKLAGGLHYSIVEMSLRGGLGDIGPVKEVAVPLPAGQAKLTEKLTAVLLPNGRDYWILVHGWENNSFYSFLLSPAGLRAAPVVSSVGAVHRSGPTGYFQGAGYLRISADGRRLAVAQNGVGVELFDFDNSTGQVSNAQALGFAADCYGLEFSADGSKLYLTANGIYQLDLAGANAAVRVGTVDDSGISLLRGNDQRIYVSHNRVGPISVINSPNAVGAGCDYQAYRVPLAAGTRSHAGLPNLVGGVPPVRAALSAASSSEACVGVPALFEAALVPAAAGTVCTWDFGDPAAGSANAASGSSTSHRYATVGAYLVTATVVGPAGTFTARQTVAVGPPPTLRLGLRQQELCAHQSLTLEASAQPAGTVFRWQDGSTAPSYVVRRPGWYRLTLRSAGGCTATDSVEVRDPGAAGGCVPLKLPNIITPNGDALNQTFVLQGLTPADWALTIYNRWGREVYQQVRYDNTWAAQEQPAGLYYYLLRNAATSEQYRGWVEVVK